MFSLVQLSCFVAVAEELHFGRAADRLSMTQPPLSRQIRLLEAELGVRLLERSSRAVSLTPAGRALLTEARRLLRLSDEAALAVRRAPAGEEGSLVLAFTAVSAQGPLAGLLGTLRDRHPRLTVVLRELVSGDQLAAIAAGDVDLGLLRPPVRGAGFSRRRLHAEPLVVVAPEGLLPGGEVTVSDLAELPLLMYSPVEARYLHELVVAAADAEGVALRPVQYVAQAHTMVALAAAGLGVALVPASAAATLPEGVVSHPLTEAPQAELYAAWRTNSDNPALQRAIDALDDAAQRLASE
jgi:DNA-binding transcriptional LysR family regulator